MMISVVALLRAREYVVTGRKEIHSRGERIELNHENKGRRADIGPRLGPIGKAVQARLHAPLHAVAPLEPDICSPVAGCVTGKRVCFVLACALGITSCSMLCRL